MCNHLVVEISQVNLSITFEHITHAEIQDNGMRDVATELPEPQMPAGRNRRDLRVATRGLSSSTTDQPDGSLVRILPTSFLPALWDPRTDASAVCSVSRAVPPSSLSELASRPIAATS